MVFFLDVLLIIALSVSIRTTDCPVFSEENLTGVLLVFHQCGNIPYMVLKMYMAVDNHRLCNINLKTNG